MPCKKICGSRRVYAQHEKHWCRLRAVISNFVPGANSHLVSPGAVTMQHPMSYETVEDVLDGRSLRASETSAGLDEGSALTITSTVMPRLSDASPVHIPES